MIKRLICIILTISIFPSITATASLAEVLNNYPEYQDVAGITTYLLEAGGTESNNINTFALIRPEISERNCVVNKRAAEITYEDYIRLTEANYTQISRVGRQWGRA